MTDSVRQVLADRYRDRYVAMVREATEPGAMRDRLEALAHLDACAATRDARANGPRGLRLGPIAVLPAVPPPTAAAGGGAMNAANEDRLRRVQRRRIRGWRMPEGAVYVGRPSRWGNPYVVGTISDHRPARYGLGDQIVVREVGRRRYRDDYLAGLAGRDLVCWCPLGQRCHADVLLELANA
jgi:hypothetical protein